MQRHHLFPRKYLEGLGITDLKQVNQIANLAVLEWHDNLSISATDPAVYWPAYLDAMRNPPDGMAPFTETEIESMMRSTRYPTDGRTCPLSEFLVERRRLMARVIREAYERLVTVSRGGRDRRLAAVSGRGRAPAACGRDARRRAEVFSEGRHARVAESRRR